MRMITALVLGWILAASPLYAQEAGIAEISETPRVATRTSVVPIPAVRHATQFVVKCELYAADGASGSKPVSAPSLVILEGQQGSISSESQTPFVTGIRPGSEDTPEPLVTTLREGTSGTVTVVSLAGDHVHVDASFAVSSIRSVDKVPGVGEGSTSTQAPVLATESWRVVRTVELGKPFEVRDAAGDNGKLVARMVIDRPGIDEAAITPISAAEGDATEDSEVYTVVYAVDDLLEQYAQGLPANQVKPSDFVLLTEMLRKQAGIEWPEGCSMRPFTANRSLVVSQTRAGHQRISELMEEKRTNVADARKLLTR
ncbi:hypothetical protein [Aeoliella sp. SH292]|uniref:hypothetical protein n=1 Tax=Aeoliella sp. SH292 TaxID=3454464 RepID=UPI003F9C5AF0